MLVEIIQKLYQIEIAIDENIEDISNFFYQYILTLRSYKFDLKFSITKSNNDQKVIISNISNIIEKISYELLKNVLHRELEIREIIKDNDIIIQVVLSDKLTKYGWSIIVSVCGVLTSLIIVVISVLFYKGYLNSIIFFFTKELFSLPEEISWPFIHQLKYPYKV
jgi:hypothetical protein